MSDYKDYATIYNLLKVKQWTQKDIAKHFDVGEDTISAWVKKHSLIKQSTRDTVLGLWDNYGSISQVASEAGIKECSVRYHLRKAGVEYTKRAKLTPADIENGMKMGLSFSAIAKEHDVDVSHVSAMAKRNNISSAQSPTPKKDLDESLLVELYNNGESLNSLAAKFGASVPLISRRLRVLGHKIRSGGQQLSKVRDYLGDILVSFDTGTTLSELAVKHSVHINTIRRALMSAGISFSIQNIPQLDNAEWLRKTYKGTSSALAIAAKLGCSHGRIYSALRRFDIDRDNTYNQFSKFPLLDDHNALQEEYITKSSGTIANSIGCSCGTVTHYLKKHGIKLRTHDEQIELMQKTISERYGWLDTGVARAIKSSQYFSKVGSRLLLDSDMERKLAERLEADPSVSSFRRGSRISATDHAGRKCTYGPDFDVIYKSGKETHIECKPYKGLSRLAPESRSRMYHQFWAGKQAYGDSYIIYDKSKIWSADEILDNMDDIDLYRAYNYADFFKSGDDLARFLRKVGWCGIRHTSSEMREGLSRLLDCHLDEEIDTLDNSVSCSSMRLIYHFHDNLFNSWYSTYPSIANAFERLDLLKAACIRLYSSHRKRRIWLHPLLVELSKLGAPIVSQFKPRIAARIIAKYCRPGGLVLDPCAGWGARALGAMKCCVDYHGLDINESTNAGTRKMLEFAKSDYKIDTLDCRSKWPVDEVDMVFTSPPYDDTEYYDGYPEGYRPDTNSIVKSIFEQSARCLSDGVLVLNVPLWSRDVVLGHAKTYGFKLVAEHKLQITQILIKGEKYEPILVFSK